MTTLKTAVKQTSIKRPVPQVPRVAVIYTFDGNNIQRLGSTGDYDRRLKRPLQRCALRKFHVTDDPNTRDQIAKSA